MDIPVLLSHRTAWLVHHAPPELVAAVHTRDYQVLVPNHSPQQTLDRVRTALMDCGIPEDQLTDIDLLANFDFERTAALGVNSHVLGQVLPSHHIDLLTEGIFVTDDALTFILAGTWMSPVELIEYGYEVCGNYRLGFGPTDPFTEKTAGTSRQDIKELLLATPGIPGSRAAERALRRVRDGSASPMETATAIMLATPRSLGGLGLRSFELNARVDIPPEQRICTKSEYFDVDVRIQRKHKMLAIEYKGGHHDEAERKGSDAEREAVLAALGYRVISLTSEQFANQLSLHRAFNSICSYLGIEIDTSRAFQARQNELRKQVIRNWK